MAYRVGKCGSKVLFRNVTTLACRLTLREWEWEKFSIQSDVFMCDTFKKRWWEIDICLAGFFCFPFFLAYELKQDVFCSPLLFKHY